MIEDLLSSIGNPLLLMIEQNCSDASSGCQDKYSSYWHHGGPRIPSSRLEVSTKSQFRRTLNSTMQQEYLEEQTIEIEE